MNYMLIDDMDTRNCKGVGVSIFVSGCNIHCKDCFNKEAWDFNNGEEFTEKTMSRLIALVRRSYIDSFSVLGGEPFDERNREQVLEIVKEMRSLKKPILKMFIWSGNLYENLIKDPICEEILSICDYLIDGQFIKEKYDSKLLLRGSSNQRIIDLKATREQGEVVTVTDWEK